MVDDRESPSAGWREVYEEMDVDTGIEDSTAPCPDCGRACERVLRDVYECERHGVFRASAGDARDADGEADAKNRAPGIAD